jgi:hypothetical protein
MAISAAPQAVSLAPPVDSALPISERIGVLDVLRGVALLGMFVVHFNYYEGTPREAMTPGSIASTVETIIGLLFEERFYAIFGMLFGVGFAVQLSRAEARGDRFVLRYLRRLAMLAVFGFIAEGVFGYNVLFGYAMWGLPLILVRRWPTWALIVLVILCAASWPIYNLTRMAWYSRRPNGIEQFQSANRARVQRFQAARAQLEAAKESPDWKTVVAARIEFMPTFHRQWSILPRKLHALPAGIDCLPARPLSAARGTPWPDHCPGSRRGGVVCTGPLGLPDRGSTPRGAAAERGCSGDHDGTRDGLQSPAASVAGLHLHRCHPPPRRAQPRALAASVRATGVGGPDGAD